MPTTVTPRRENKDVVVNMVGGDEAIVDDFKSGVQVC